VHSVDELRTKEPNYCDENVNPIKVDISRETESIIQVVVPENVLEHRKSMNQRALVCFCDFGNSPKDSHRCRDGQSDGNGETDFYSKADVSPSSWINKTATYFEYKSDRRISSTNSKDNSQPRERASGTTESVGQFPEGDVFRPV